MKILVTGGAGFIGSHLVEALVARGEHVRVLDNLATGHLENLALVRAQIEFIQGDLADLETVQAAAAETDVVFHQAALPSVPRSIKNPRASHDANLTGTLNVLIAARDRQVQRVVMASSSSVYGNSPALPKVETFEPAPLSPYAVTKLAGEYYARVFADLYGLSTICLRYFNVFGPRQDPHSQYSGALAKFVQCALHGEPYPIHGDGEQSRDFTYIENVVRANLLAASSETDGALVVNVAGGARTTLNQIIATLNELTQQTLPTQFGPPRAGDVRHSHADISRARELLGYEPTVQVREGLRRTVDWYKLS
ncbi:MAG: SDR family oxidoreductase [Chloroflexi bacterium]|nr:SDR family oxidoreductase [Chloroflexota bacterium]